jgi:hypothetical protein
MRLTLPVILTLAAFASLFLIVMYGSGQHLLVVPESIFIQKK